MNTNKYYEHYKKIIILVRPNKDYGFDWVIDDLDISGWNKDLDSAVAEAKEAINSEESV